ncbi:MAG: response regulator, partial [Chloroflexota bacterium]
MDIKNQLKVLVIDDNRQIREFVTKCVLEPEGFQVEVACDGAEGLAKALTIKPDLILMDYEMPRLTGLEVLQRLRNDNCKTPVILMTSHGSEQIAIEFFRLGLQDYITKPFQVDHLLDIIENVLSVTYLERERDTLMQRVFHTNKQLEQRIHEFNALFEMGKSINSLNHPRKVLDRIAESVLEIMDAEECTLILGDPSQNRIDGQIKKQRTQLCPASSTNTPVPAKNGKSQPTEKILLGNSLVSPLKIGETVLGTIIVRHRLDQYFTEHDKRLLHMVSDYAAIAIHNLQLVHQLHLTKEREKQQIRTMFERYVAPTVVEEILTQPEKMELGGTRRAVTVLFADMRGFSSFSSGLSPEILIELLNKYMRMAADAVLTEGGTLDKFMGDGVMAFFNAPLTQTDHTLRAIRAAWRLCRAVEKLHAFLLPQEHLRFGVGVGVGETVVGNIGTPQMMNYTVIGDAVNKVKRLQENAAGGQILISQETYYLV